MWKIETIIHCEKYIQICLNTDGFDIDDLYTIISKSINENIDILLTINEIDIKINTKKINSHFALKDFIENIEEVYN